MPDSNTVVVGPAEQLLKQTCTLEEVSLDRRRAADGARPRPGAQVRYRAAEVPCTVAPAERAGELRVEFDQPQRAITPGQALVVYDGEYVLGGGTIRP